MRCETLVNWLVPGLACRAPWTTTSRIGGAGDSAAAIAGISEAARKAARIDGTLPGESATKIAGALSLARRPRPRCISSCVTCVTPRFQAMTPAMLTIDLTGKHALVAGVADDGGFGFAIAKALAEAGAKVSVATWPPA